MSCDVTRRGVSAIRLEAKGAKVSFPTEPRAFPGTYAVDLRVAARPGVIAAAAKAAGDHVYVVTDTGHVWDSGEQASGNQCCALRTTATGFEVAYVRYIDRDQQGRQWRRVRLSETLDVLGWSDHPVPTPDGMTADGFLDWIDDTPIFAGLHRVTRLGGVGFVQAMRRGQWTAGLHFDNWPILYDHARNRVLVARQVTAQGVIRLALDSADKPVVAVCTQERFLELPAFTEYSAEPVPTPAPPPNEPEPSMPLPDESAIYDRIVAVRATYGPEPDNDDCVAILNTVAGEFPGVGLMEKTGGNRGRRSDGVECSVDYLQTQDPPMVADVFKDAGGHEDDGRTKPIRFSWRALEGEESPDRFVAPLRVQPQPPIVVPKPPTPPSVPDTPPAGPSYDVAAAMREMGAAIVANTEAINTLVEEVAALRQVVGTGGSAPGGAMVIEIPVRLKVQEPA